MNECVIKTPIGKLAIRSEAGVLKSIRISKKKETPISPESKIFVNAVDRYFTNPDQDLPKSIAFDFESLTPFEVKVLHALQKIRSGKTTSYKKLAEKAGYPGAARAVGSVMRKNRFPLLIPCHRVVRSDGKIGEYSLGGPEVKKQLLDLEKSM